MTLFTKLISVSVFGLLAVYATQTQASSSDDKSRIQRIQEKAQTVSYPLTYDGQVYSGEGWELLLNEARKARFFLLGEEHGIAENAELAAALFAALTPAGYRHLAIEVSPPMAALLDTSAQTGIEGLRQHYRDPAKRAAFFGMLEEAQMLARIRSTLPEQRQVFWGLDYEVLGDRALIRSLDSPGMPAQARPHYNRLRDTANTSWQEYSKTRNPQFIFSFNGDPQLVSNLSKHWSEADAGTQQVLHTLEHTLQINQLWMSGKGYDSNLARVELLRHNFMQYWQSLPDNTNEKVFFKFGSSHMQRGLSPNGTYDLGTLIPEVAQQRGETAFHLMVIPGVGSQTAVLDITTMRFNASEPKDGYSYGLEALTQQVREGHFTLIDLRPLRALTVRQDETVPAKLREVVFGFDALLVMTGSRASGNLLQPDPAD